MLPEAVLAGLVAGAVSIVTLVLQRRWKKQDDAKDEKSGIVQRLDNLDEKITGVADALDSHVQADARRAAITCRTRILRFADELINEPDRLHTQGHFEQILADISDYDHYCAEHPEFKNSVTEQSAEIIKDTYAKCARERSFL